MPIAHNLNKVTKNLAKSTAQAHTKGRKFKQLNRATLRNQKISQKKVKHLERKGKELVALKYMQENVVENGEMKTFTLQEMKTLIETFLTRNDEELAALRAERRPGRPPTSRQQMLEEVVEHEKQVYYSGFQMPDLSDKENVERLRRWNGTTGGTTAIRFIRVSKDMETLPTREQEMKD